MLYHYRFLKSKSVHERKREENLQEGMEAETKKEIEGEKEKERKRKNKERPDTFFCNECKA